LTVFNKGEVLLTLVEGFTRVQQMTPWPQDFLEAVSEEEDPIEDDRTEVNWPLIEERRFVFEIGEREVEPQEQDEFYFDFVIDAKVQTIVVYTYLKNQVKRGREIGWGITSVYDLHSPSEGGNTHGTTKKNRQEEPRA
jgi:hypothetical protein